MSLGGRRIPDWSLLCVLIMGTDMQQQLSCADAKQI